MIPDLAMPHSSLPQHLPVEAVLKPYFGLCKPTGGRLQVFAGDEVKDMPGHLMLYPYAVDNAGVVTAVTEFIPDTKKAKVLGTRSISLPCPLTT